MFDPLLDKLRGDATESETVAGDATVLMASPEDAALLAINDFFNALVEICPWTLVDGWIVEIQGHVIALWTTIGPAVMAAIAAGTPEAFKAAFIAAMLAVSRVNPTLSVVVRLAVVIVNVRWKHIFAKAQPRLAARGVKV